MWQEYLITIICAVLTALVSWGMTALVKLINTKVKNEKAARMTTEAITIVYNAVKTVMQSYVDTLKAKGEFTAEAQKAAAQKAFNIALGQMSEELKEYVTTNYGDLTAYIYNLIEAYVLTVKEERTARAAG